MSKLMNDLMDVPVFVVLWSFLFHSDKRNQKKIQAKQCYLLRLFTKMNFFIIVLVRDTKHVLRQYFLFF